MNSKLNLQQIQELLLVESTTDEEIVRPLLDLLRSQLSEVIEKMVISNQARAGNETSKLAHYLKSASAQLGLTGFSDLCLALETRGHQHPESDFTFEIQSIYYEGIKSMAELEAHLSGQDALKSSA